jgi:hypothetical protein
MQLVTTAQDGGLSPSPVRIAMSQKQHADGNDGNDGNEFAAP